MDEYIKIERIPYEEPYHLQLIWEISNGRLTSRFEFYDNATSLLEFAERLETFPRHASDVYLYEIGSEREEDNFAYYFRFRAFTTDSKGTPAIQIRFCNNSELPYREITEFCIQPEAASINRLGQLFREFAKLEKHYLSWSGEESFVGEKRN